MFGGQDNNAVLPQTGGGSAPQDDPLKGVTELVGVDTPAPVTQVPVTTPTTQSSPFFPPPTDMQQGGAPTLPDDSATTAVATPAVSSDALLDLKQQALQELTPLVSHLEQTPIEKFRTTMMLIQASDNQALLKEAYEAAQKIQDEKTRAQALLDVVNEINYFTQPKEQ